MRKRPKEGRRLRAVGSFFIYSCASASAVCAEHRDKEDILADRDLITARKGKTMTKHMNGDREVQRDLEENENCAPWR
jgi:hypothetical protein